MPSVYSYQKPRQFLADTLSARQHLNHGFSVRRWADEMEISHSLLSMLLQGKRPLRLKHLSTITKGLSLNPAERLGHGSSSRKINFELGRFYRCP